VGRVLAFLGRGDAFYKQMTANVGSNVGSR